MISSIKFFYLDEPQANHVSIYVNHQILEYFCIISAHPDPNKKDSKHHLSVIPFDSVEEYFSQEEAFFDLFCMAPQVFRCIQKFLFGFTDVGENSIVVSEGIHY
jgi:hypothetical protein